MWFGSRWDSGIVMFFRCFPQSGDASMSCALTLGTARCVADHSLSSNHSLFSSVRRPKYGLCLNSGDSPLRRRSFTVIESFDRRSLLGSQRHCLKHRQPSLYDILRSSTPILLAFPALYSVISFHFFVVFTFYFFLYFFFCRPLFLICFSSLFPPCTHLSIRSVCFNRCLWFLFCLL